MSCTTEYRGAHTAPGPHLGATMDRADEYMPDVYDRRRQFQLYGFDRAVDEASFAALNRAHRHPGEPITVYRAVPLGVIAIRVGDWVTPSLRYAAQHLDGQLNGLGAILSVTVRADRLWTNGDSVNEWGVA